MTCRFLSRLTIAAGISLGFLTVQANAWGPTAQKSIVATAFQVLSHLQHNPFKSADVSYEAQVLQGAVNYRAELAGVPMNTRAEAMNAVGTEIQLLREVRQYGIGSYFSYRMGVLAGLVSDIMLPFTFEGDAQSQRMLKQINDDVEAHLTSYRMTARPRRLEYIRNPLLYFRERHAFYEDAKVIIVSDYQVGRGYEGYMAKGGQKFFEGAVVAVADTWHTVLRPQGDASEMEPSTKLVTWYLVNEIQFLLTEKKNLLEAEKVYQRLASVESGSQEVYERVGDAFYAFDVPESRERAVQEWDAALAMSGPNRNRIKGKLSGHYLEEGKEYYAAASNPDAPDETLILALQAFTKALEYDRTSGEAASLIGEAQIAISERNERQRMAIQTVASAESVLRQAETAFAAEQNEEALANYEKAILVFDQVSTEFKDQAQAARDGKETANRMIGRIIRRVLTQAQDQIDEGDRLVEDKLFDEGVSRFASVETILKVVPDQEGPDAEEKRKLIEEANGKVQDAERAKIQYEELKKSQAAAAAAQGNQPARTTGR